MIVWNRQSDFECDGTGDYALDSNLCVVTFTVNEEWDRVSYLEALGNATRPIFGLLWDVE